MDLSELFDSIAAELGQGRASAEFFPYRELKHTWRRRGNRLAFRISDYLKGAPDQVLESLAWHLISKSNEVHCPSERSTMYLDYVHSKSFWLNNRRVYVSRARNLTIEPRGKWRNLNTVFDYVNSTYFSGRLRLPILGWVDESPSRRLGYFFEPLHMLVINKVFDSDRIPRFVLEFVVYHELLHYVDAESGRRSHRVHHTKDFKKQEKMFSSSVEAERWLRMLVAESRRKRK